MQANVSYRETSDLILEACDEKRNDVYKDVLIVMKTTADKVEKSVLDIMKAVSTALKFLSPS